MITIGKITVLTGRYQPQSVGVSFHFSLHAEDMILGTTSRCPSIFAVLSAIES